MNPESYRIDNHGVKPSECVLTPCFFFADVCSRIRSKLDREGSVGESWPWELKMDTLWISYEGRAKAKVEPRTS